MKDAAILLVLLVIGWLGWHWNYVAALLIRNPRKRFERLCMLGLGYFEHKQFRDAIRCLRAAIAEESHLDDPPGPERAARAAGLFAALAYAYGCRRDYAGAGVNARLAVTLDPDCAWGHCALGMAEAALGRLDNAVLHFEKAIRFDKQSGEPHSDIRDTAAGTLRMYGCGEERITHVLHGGSVVREQQ